MADARATGLLLRSADLDLPLPGSGQTLRRWEALAQLTRQDCSLGRLAEGHTDAVAILAELDGPSPIGRWGVWAAEPPTSVVTAERSGYGWVLEGEKAWCSGALVLDWALVTARTSDGPRLFAVDVNDLEPDEDSWPAVGMAGSGTLRVGFSSVRGVPVGQAGSYVERPGFAHGGIGVAACWWGGACGVADALVAAAPTEPHALAHLGAVTTLLTGLHDTLAVAAAEVDEDPLDRKGGARLRAARVRAAADLVADEVITRVGRALGAGPLCLSREHAERVADLTVYTRQSHGERDLAALGKQVLEQPAW